MPSLRATEREPYSAIDRFPIRAETLPFGAPVYANGRGFLFTGAQRGML
jgi:hypothetical protein